MSRTDYAGLASTSLAEGTIPDADILRVLKAADADLPAILAAAWTVRRRFFGHKVRIHILNNLQSGGCTEDCRYCGQSAASGNRDKVWPLKPLEEIVREADRAAKAGAYRHCMALSGRDLLPRHLPVLTEAIRRIKRRHPRLELCLSAGFLDEATARSLKESGLDRYNHNLNTTRRFYPRICSTHSYDDRLRTLRTARAAGLAVCSGVIIGMGEPLSDIVRLCRDLADLRADSVPVNFFIPVRGHRVRRPSRLSPTFCLKVLCAFRLALPRTELRMAAGREHHLRSLQPLGLYPCNSLFAQGYLTAGGDDLATTLAMIRDAGFIPELHD